MSAEDLEELYQDTIIDHFKHPRCHGECEHPCSECDAFNPLCGDKIKLTVEGDLTQIRAIKFKGQGCSVSQASASMMCELCEKKSAKEIFELKKIFEGMILNRELSESEKLELLGDAKVLRSIQKFPARYRCALLAWNAVEECLAKIDVKIDSKNIDKSR